MSYDPACHVLASYFLKGESLEHDEEDVAELAQEIQDTIEEWLEMFRDEQNDEPNPT